MKYFSVLNTNHLQWMNEVITLVSFIDLFWRIEVKLENAEQLATQSTRSINKS